MAGLGLLLVGGAIGWWYAWQAALDTPIAIDAPTLYTIEPGMSIGEVASTLRRREIIHHPHYLVFEAQRRGTAGQIKAGEYRLLPGTTARQLLALFVSGRVVQHTLTLIEGWSYAQIIQAVMNHETLVRTLDDLDDRAVMARLGYPGQHPEGRFFPDTYHFPAGTRDIDFLKRAYQKMAAVLEQEWQQRQDGLPYQNVDEALTMASIIEKETALVDEYATIAGVFVRRLHKGMRLQSDPTVIYAMGDAFDGNIRRRDLALDSPYNTYIQKGLPPTPIASPGAAAIHAALHPEPGEALYFVAIGDGRHYFSKTLREHNRAVAKYQLRR